jgi:hypothetical protein
MVTLRAFFTPAEAALAKSLLDDHGIDSSLADENSYLYGGAPFAMPVRLMVAKEQLEEAARILEDPPDGLNVAPALQRQIAQVGSQLTSEQEETDNNPWQLLVIALLAAIPGVMLLAQKRDLLLVSDPRRGRYWTSVIPPNTSHVLGALVLVVSCLLVFLYFYVRREIARDQARREDEGVRQKNEAKAGIEDSV